MLPAALLAVYLFVLSSCLKDKCSNSVPSKIYTPVFTTLASIRSAVRSESPQDIVEPGKIYLYGKYIYLNELNKGIHVIDNTNPSAPQKIAFINIPGNVDLAIKNGIMYADSYVDLVALDIKDPHNIHETKRLASVFPYRQYGYGIVSDGGNGVITSFNVKDTVLTNVCNNSDWNGDYLYTSVNNSVTFSNQSSVTVPSAAGKAGSYARFGLVDNTLYTVATASIQVFSIQNTQDPVQKNKLAVNADIETIFPVDHYLFLGTTTGMLIYDVSNPETPAALGTFAHLRACDPVVVNGTTAYVTLRAGSNCGGITNELDVLNVADVKNPTLLKIYAMTSPYGVGIDGNKLFVCEGAAGLKFMDATDPLNITTKKTLTDVNAYDVIPNNNILLVTATGGFYQYDYTNMSEPKLLSKIGVVSK
jgi:hypothetical protein